MQTFENPSAARPRSRDALVIAALVTAVACEPAPAPVVGISSNPTHVNAARLALFEAEAEGRSELPDTLVIMESTSDAVPALRAASRFAHTPGIAAVLGHSHSAASLAAARVYNDAKVLQLAPTASAVHYGDAGPYSFRMVPPDSRQGAFLARVLQDSLPEGSAVALLYVNDDYGRGLRNAVLAALDRMGSTFQVSLDLPHTGSLPRDTVMRAHLLDAVGRAEPDAILWLGRVLPLAAVLPELRVRFGSIPVYGGDAVSAASLIPRDPELWTGVHYIDFLDLSASAEGRRFADRYERRYGLAASGAEALWHDGMAVLLAAIQAGARTGPEVRQYLLSLGRERPPFPGVTGPVRFEPEGFVDRSYHLVEVGS